ncbi:group-specific protein [Alkalihalobacillus sp. MEB130]|uniref:hypothetical protein n=1 Tax=Alkalihalobacillus sp. MEB130 TaxID=2976704 RepID=UPI0028DF4D96|nr:hypothetical protein [Alkalihalobacillus sp. MEB130]MDT8862380.1 group-specific protein [Alkalihalobacillus sp. MEB130]
MSSCKLDHPLEDVLAKLESQKEFLPEDLYVSCQRFLELDVTQTELNELFHLLKKYDLSSEEEQLRRNIEMKQLVRA